MERLLYGRSGCFGCDHHFIDWEYRHFAKEYFYEFKSVAELYDRTTSGAKNIGRVFL